MPEVTVVEVLKEALTLAQEGHWCQGHVALTAQLRAVSPIHADAQDFCLEGMLWRAWYQLVGQPLELPRATPLEGAFRAVARQVTGNVQGAIIGGDIAFWNDQQRRTLDQVITALEGAIACLK